MKRAFTVNYHLERIVISFVTTKISNFTPVPSPAVSRLVAQWNNIKYHIIHLFFKKNSGWQIQFRPLSLQANEIARQQWNAFSESNQTHLVRMIRKHRCVSIFICTVRPSVFVFQFYLSHSLLLKFASLRNNSPGIHLVMLIQSNHPRWVFLFYTYNISFHQYIGRCNKNTVRIWSEISDEHGYLLFRHR